ncbi:MAG: DUF6470 family protein [Clostridia bacterium]|nr:DUF6470 family protein [Clostridia bacterium]
MGLVISQTYAKIGVNRTPESLEIHSQNARLQIHQKHAKVNLHTEHPRVEIDSYEARASAGLKNDIDLMREAAQMGYQQVMEYIGKVAADGDTLAAVERGGEPIADIAERDAYPTHEFNIDFIPKTGPNITVKGGVNIDPERNSEGINNGVEGSFVPASMELKFTPSKVTIFLQQYASVNISYQGTNVDSYI